MIKKIFTKITEKLLKAGKAFSKAPQRSVEATQDLTTNKEEKPDIEAHTSPQEVMDVLIKEAQDSGMDYQKEEKKVLATSVPARKREKSIKNMKTSKEGKKMITHLEGISRTKYLCSSNWWTIGVGATKSEIPDISSWPLNRSITIKKAFKLLDKSLIKYENAVRAGLKKDVPQPVFDALVSFIYNVGVGWANNSSLFRKLRQFRDFTRLEKVINLVGQGDDEAKIIRKRYTRRFLNKLVRSSGEYRVVSKNSVSCVIEASELWHLLMRFKKPFVIVGRRSKEAKLLITGQYSGYGKAALITVNSKGRPRYNKTIDLNEYL